MYREEEVINGVLCVRHTPSGEWKPLSPEELTERIQWLKESVELKAAVIKRITNSLNEEE